MVGTGMIHYALLSRNWRSSVLSPKPKLIDPSWTLEKRIWWALEAISDRCDGARKLDGAGYSKYDRPIADRLQGLHLSQWSSKDIDDGLHLIRKYRKQLESIGISVDDVIGDMGMVVTVEDDHNLDNTIVPRPSAEADDAMGVPASWRDTHHDPILPNLKDTNAIGEPIYRPKKVNVALEDDSNSGNEVYCEFLTGSSGTGKTFELRRRIAEDPNYAILSSTTGISAINLGAITINSLLGYYNTESLEESMIKGYLEKRLRDIVDSGYKNLALDEISMCDKLQLDMIYEGIRRVNERSGWHDSSKLGLVVTGDFCQLPPIKADWAFRADCWPKFEANTTRLTKCWRQSDAKFLEAINYFRQGNGRDGVRILKDIGIPFSMQSDKQFDGTTIMAKNDAVDGYNFIAHSRVNGRLMTVKNTRWGKLRKEWDNIPAELSLKIGAYCMVLHNDTPKFSFVNGDCGHVMDFAISAGDESVQGSGAFRIELVRNSSYVEITHITRFNYQKDAPRELGEDNRSLRAAYRYDPDSDDLPLSPAFDVKAKKWIVGGITYYPLRLAYATTVHKSQSLSLPRLQMDVSSHFMSAPAMMYVAISRCSDPAGLRIVGTMEAMAEKTKIHPEVLKYL